MFIVTTKSGTRYRFVPQGDKVLVYRQYAVLDPDWCRPDTHISTLTRQQVAFINIRQGKSMNIPTHEGSILSTPVAEITYL
jgi:hypothetical protein